MMGKYPFVLTVYRAPGGQKPLLQRYSFEALGTAHAAMTGHFKDRTVTKVDLSIVLEEITRAEREAAWRMK